MTRAAIYAFLGFAAVGGFILLSGIVAGVLIALVAFYLGATGVVEGLAAAGTALATVVFVYVAFTRAWAPDCPYEPEAKL